MRCKNCENTIDKDSKFCGYCGTVQESVDTEIKDKESILNIQENINDYLRKLELDIKEKDIHDDESTESWHRIDNLSIDIGNKLTDINTKMSSMVSDSTRILVQEFENSINRETKPFGDILYKELKQLEDSINREIEQKNMEFEVMEKNIVEYKKRILIEKQEFLSNLWTYQLRKIKEEKDRQIEFEQKQTELENRQIKFESGAKQEQGKFEQRQKEFNDQITIFEKQIKEFNKKKVIALIIIAFLFIIYLIILLI